MRDINADDLLTRLGRPAKIKALLLLGEAGLWCNGPHGALSGPIAPVFGPDQPWQSWFTGNNARKIAYYYILSICKVILLLVPSLFIYLLNAQPLSQLLTTSRSTSSCLYFGLHGHAGFLGDFDCWFCLHWLSPFV